MSQKDHSTTTTGSTTAQGTLLSHATRYRDRGWSVIPVGQDKVPAVTWEPFQHRCPSQSELDRWFNPSYNGSLGIVTGGVSNLRVLDVDQWSSEWMQVLWDRGGLPETLEVRTGKGSHFYFKQGGNGRSAKGTERTIPSIDIRGEGGYVVAPPSVHVSGRAYEFVDPDVPIAEWPGWLDDLFFPPVPDTAPVAATPSEEDTAYGRAALKRLRQELRQASPGSRNETLLSTARQVGQLITSGYLSTKLREPLRTELIDIGAWNLGQGSWQATRTVDNGLTWGEAHPFVKPDLPVEPAPKYPSIDDLRGGPSVRSWLVDGWFPSGCLVAFSGEQYAGKSSIMRHFVAMLTNKDVRCVWSSTEEDYGLDVLPGLDRMGARTALIDYIPAWEQEMNPDNMERLSERLQGVGLCILDNGMQHIPPGDEGWENKHGYVQPKLQALQSIAMATGCTIVLILHDNKIATSGWKKTIGASAWTSVPRGVLGIDQWNEKNKRGIFTVRASNLSSKPQ